MSESLEIENLSFNDKVSIAMAQFKNRLGYFYVIFQSYCNIVENNDIPTAMAEYNYLTKTFTVQINSEFAESTDELAFVIMHEFFHILLGHFFRPYVIQMNKKNKQVTNVILDAQINTIINNIFSKNNGLYENINEEDVSKSKTRSKKINDMRKNNIPINSVTRSMNGIDFDILEESIKENKELSKQNRKWIFKMNELYKPIESWLEELQFLYETPSAKMMEQLQQLLMSDHTMVDESQNGNNQNGQEEDIQEKIENSLGSLLKDAKEKFDEKMGNDPANGIGNGNELFDRLFKQYTKPKKRFLIPSMMRGLREIERLGSNPTYTQYNKLQAAYTYPKKTFLPERLGKIVIAIDLSGSISEEDLLLIQKKIAQIKNEVDLIFWSSEDVINESTNVYKNFTKKTKLNPQTTGGTSFKALFKYVKKHYEGKKVLFGIFSDFEVDLRKLPGNVNSLWLFNVSKYTESANTAFNTYSKVTKAKLINLIEEF